MSGFATVSASGKIVGDVKHVQGRLNFTIMWSRYVGKGKGYNGSNYENQFLPCVLFGNYADTMADRIHTGTRAAVTGKLAFSSFNNKEGQKVDTTSCIIDSLDIIDTGDQGSGSGRPVVERIETEDIPF